jgi:hypothetical protein
MHRRPVGSRLGSEDPWIRGGLTAGGRCRRHRGPTAVTLAMASIPCIALTTCLSLISPSPARASVPAGLHGAWTRQAVLTSATGQLSGPAALVGDAALVCGTNEGVDSLYAFVDNAGVWQQSSVTPVPDCGQGDPIEVSGTSALVPGDVRGEPSAYVFSETGTSWAETGRLIISHGQRAGEMAFSGTTAVIAGTHDDGTTVAFVFVDTGSGWTRQAVLAPKGGTLTQQVGLSGTTTIISGYKGGQAAVYVFSDSGGTWSQVAVLTAPGAVGAAGVNGGIFISGGLIVAAAPDRDRHQGVVYEFTQSVGGSWSQSGAIAGPGRNVEFGSALNGAGSTLMVATAPTLSQHQYREVVAYSVTGGSLTQTHTFNPFGISPTSLTGYLSSPAGLVLVNNHNVKGPGYELASLTGGSWNVVLAVPAPHGLNPPRVPLAIDASIGLVEVNGSVFVYGPQSSAPQLHPVSKATPAPTRRA